MAQWKPLPDDLEPQVFRLVVRLRELRDQLGVSMSALARKTPYSKSSWARYLSGRTLPPRGAVEALSRLAGADPARLLALWELAAQAPRAGRRPDEGTQTGPRVGIQTGPHEGIQNEGTQTGPDPAGTRPGQSRRARTVAAAAGAVVLAGLGLVAWLTSGGHAFTQAHSGSSSAQRPGVLPAGYGCTYAWRDGRLYAGHSTTSDRLVALNAGSEDAVEVQCLLKHHGLSPGRVDGLFGEHTEQAVKRLQRAGGAVVDGMVGPRTWALLRR
ncbi:MAG TPA: peptidoglycan-binding protein [Mycobacteriales bacterium]|nr:peptidoglycan-binding protein [Mycobacteriales bacterium]